MMISRIDSSLEGQLAGLIGKLGTKNQKLVQSLRNVFRKKLRTVNELVYDYGRALVISYSPTERGSDAIVAISAKSDEIRLIFGVNLPDPKGILLGKGRQTRYVVVESGRLRPEVEAILTAAVRKAGLSRNPSDRGALIIKSSKRKSRPAKHRQT